MDRIPPKSEIYRSVIYHHDGGPPFTLEVNYRPLGWEGPSGAIRQTTLTRDEAEARVDRLVADAVDNGGADLRDEGPPAETVVLVIDGKAVALYGGEGIALPPSGVTTTWR